MKRLEEIGKGAARRAVLGGMLFLGFLAFAAGPASAHPRVVVRVGIGEPAVARGYYAPRPLYYSRVYVAPRYRYHYHYRYRPHRRYWDTRFHCWRYR
jgi:hypothetical protein